MISAYPVWILDYEQILMIRTDGVEFSVRKLPACDSLHVIKILRTLLKVKQNSYDEIIMLKTIPWNFSDLVRASHFVIYRFGIFIVR